MKKITAVYYICCSLRHCCVFVAVCLYQVAFPPRRIPLIAFASHRITISISTNIYLDISGQTSSGRLISLLYTSQDHTN